MGDVSMGEVVVIVGVGFALLGECFAPPCATICIPSLTQHQPSPPTRAACFPTLHFTFPSHAGRRDLPIVARAAGAAIGRAVGTIVRTRRQLDGFAKHNELMQLHDEFQRGVAEIGQIKNELTSATSVRRRPVGMVAAAAPASSASASASASPAAAAAAAASRVPRRTFDAKTGTGAGAIVGAAAQAPIPAAPALATASAPLPVSVSVPQSVPGSTRAPRAPHGPHRVALAVATEQFAPSTALDVTASGADLLSQGIVDSIWLDEHAAQGEAE